MNVCKWRIDVPLSIDHRLNKRDFTKKKRKIICHVYSMNYFNLKTSYEFMMLLLMKDLTSVISS